jgi:DNA-binding XRE family transcriptional regulator
MTTNNSKTITMKAMTKKELAMMAGVSRRTFSRWMTEREADLRKIGVKTSSHLLPPRAVKIICEHYSIDVEQ